MRHAIVRVLLVLLEQTLVRAMLLKFLGSAAAGGFKAWLIKKVVDELWDGWGQPIILYAIRKSKRIYNENKGEHLYVRLSRVRKNEDWKEYKETLDKIFGG